jgi:hypothetical protein
VRGRARAAGQRQRQPGKAHGEQGTPAQVTARRPGLQKHAELSGAQKLLAGQKPPSRHWTTPPPQNTGEQMKSTPGQALQGTPAQVRAWKPGLQRQRPPGRQVLLGGQPTPPGQALTPAPQKARTQVPPTKSWPAGQAAPQRVPSQVGVPLGTGGQGVQLVPQVAGERSLAQVDPQAWVPAGQAALQRPISHTGEPPGGVGQRLPQAPQWFTSVAVMTQSLPQRVRPAPQPASHIGAPMRITHAGEGPVQATPQAPQEVGSVRSVSQPLAGAMSQSP